MKTKQKKYRKSVLFCCTIALSWAISLHGFYNSKVAPKYPLNKSTLAAHIGRAIHRSTSHQFLPVAVDFPVRGKPIRSIVQYSVNSRLQVEMESLFDTYRPDYGAFVALDATSGRVLSLVSFSSQAGKQENLALKGTLPSASVFKVVTAAAAISAGKLSPESVIPFNGRYHTLYKRNVFEPQVNRWTRFMTLREAFAKSVNAVFGRIGAVVVGPVELRAFAQNFGFNRTIASDLPIESGHAAISDDPWELAESASGYTTQNTMSPLQGALIASAVANDGLMMEPTIVDSVVSDSGEVLYQARPAEMTVSVTPETAQEIRQLMKETVHTGTARSAFRTFFRQSPYASFLEIGGKTGSLTGHDPSGKYDWFVGYARGTGQKIAFAAVTVHQRYWKVKSAYLVRRAIEAYFEDQAPRGASVTLNRR